MRRAAALALLTALCASSPLAATEVRFFRLQSRDAFLAGTLDGVSVDTLGRLSLADRVERLGELGEPFLFAAAPHPDGWVVGTGNAGKVVLMRREGGVRTLYEAPEPEIFAVWVDADGTVFAGSSPDGKVYRIAGGEAEVYFDPAETYIWDLARGRDGSLLVATGTSGRLYRVTRRGEGEVLYDGKDTHLRTLAVLEDGAVLVGTAGEGLILRIGEGGFARTLYDAVQPEVVDLAVGENGQVYAALLASEASLVDLSAPPAPPEKGDGEKQSASAETGVSVSLSAAGTPPVAGSRPHAYQGPRSEILRLSPAGRVESLWSFDGETVYAIRWHRERLWVGTGLDGKLYSLRGRQMVLEKDVDERQVVAVMDDEPGPAFATANATALYRVSARREREGSYTSAALDAGQIAEFGSLRWQGGLEGGRVELSVRSGTSAEPDLTWSQWTPPATGAEVSLSPVPPGRYVQWRARLTGDGASPWLGRVTLSYRQLNLPPRITGFGALDPGEILVPSNFNPANQVFEPAHPNREGIFTTLEPAAGRNATPTKTLWKRGFRTLKWEAEDPNGDELVYALSFRPEGADGAWLAMAEDLDTPHYSFDATALPDGTYRFRLEVSDRGGGDQKRALSAVEVGEPVLIDHSPTRLTQVRRRGEEFRVRVEDELSPLREAVYSIDAGEWLPARPEDGILDGSREVLLLEAPREAHLVLLRLTDAAFNVATYDLLGRDE